MSIDNVMQEAHHYAIQFPSFARGEITASEIDAAKLELEQAVKATLTEEREACKRKLLIDLWAALPGHEATGDTAGSLRAMLMLSEVGDEIKMRSNVEGNRPPRTNDGQE